MLRKINFFKKTKLEENKKTEKELWDKLKGLNKEFKDIKKQQKENPKQCQKQYLRCKYFL